MSIARISKAAVLVASLLGTEANAQEERQGDRRADQQPPKWSVGAMGLFSVSPFEAEGDEFLPVPYVSYRGERFFLEGLEAGYHLVRPHRGPGTPFVADVLASARMVPGSSRDKVTVDAGLRLGLRGKVGFLSLTALQDVTGEHDGLELKARYSYTFRGRDFFITPSVGVSWQNTKLANHMWGVSASQQADMIAGGDDVILPVYQLDDGVMNYEAGLSAVYRATDRISLIGFSTASYLDKDIRANPGIDKKYDLTMGLGISYSF